MDGQVSSLFANDTSIVTRLRSTNEEVEILEDLVLEMLDNDTRHSVQLLLNDIHLDNHTESINELFTAVSDLEAEDVSLAGRLTETETFTDHNTGDIQALFTLTNGLLDNDTDTAAALAAHGQALQGLDTLASMLVQNDSALDTRVSTAEESLSEHNESIITLTSQTQQLFLSILDGSSHRTQLDTAVAELEAADALLFLNDSALQARLTHTQAFATTNNVELTQHATVIDGLLANDTALLNLIDNLTATVAENEVTINDMEEERNVLSSFFNVRDHCVSCRHTIAP